MDEEQQLMFQQELLLQELKLVEAKLNFVRLKKSEQEKVISKPCPEMHKLETSPEGTAPGKDSTNPLKVDSLPKTEEDGKPSTTLIRPSDLNLRPNGGIQIPKKTESQDPAQSKDMEKGIQIPTNQKSYYVVFNGPNAGIYDSWDNAKKASEGVSGVRHKKYKNFLEAKTSAGIYCREKMVAPLQLITSAEMLKPNNYAQALSNKGKTKVSLGKLPVKEPVDEPNTLDELTVKDFMFLYSNARRAGEEMMVEEHYFTTDKKNISYYNFCKNSNPEQVFEIFRCGLLRTIYPSSNLMEIRNFPKEIRHAVKKFRTKCLNNSEKDLFLKIQSSIPTWNTDGSVQCPSYHLIQIGVSNGEKYYPSQVTKDQLEEKDLPDLSKKCILKLMDQIINFKGDDKIFVNYQDDKCLIYSVSFKKMNKESENAIIAFQKTIISGRVLGDHDTLLCDEVKKKTAQKKMPFSCKVCTKDDRDHHPTCKNASKGQDSQTASTSASTAHME